MCKLHLIAIYLATLTLATAAYGQEQTRNDISLEGLAARILMRCWNPHPTGSPKALSVRLAIQIHTDGTLRDVFVAPFQRKLYETDPEFRAFADEAIHAVKDCPYKDDLAKLNAQTLITQHLTACISPLPPEYKDSDTPRLKVSFSETGLVRQIRLHASQKALLEKSTSFKNAFNAMREKLKQCEPLPVKALPSYTFWHEIEIRFK